jgi:mRNA interferase MazF
MRAKKRLSKGYGSGRIKRAGGRGQVVRHQPSKLIFAGPNPVARSNPPEMAGDCFNLTSAMGACGYLSMHKQAGRRPAPVLSPRAYNTRVGPVLMCPVTQPVKGYPFEVLLPKDAPIQGTVLSDQIKCLDWRLREAEHAWTLPVELVLEVSGKLSTLLK